MSEGFLFSFIFLNLLFVFLLIVLERKFFKKESYVLSFKNLWCLSCFSLNGAFDALESNNATSNKSFWGSNFVFSSSMEDLKSSAVFPNHAGSYNARCGQKSSLEVLQLTMHQFSGQIMQACFGSSVGKKSKISWKRAQTWVCFWKLPVCQSEPPNTHRLQIKLQIIRIVPN